VVEEQEQEIRRLKAEKENSNYERDLDNTFLIETNLHTSEVD